jgi:hypothetical protein
MAGAGLADEIRWLVFRDPSHAGALLSLLAKARIDTADDMFVPLYALAAAGPHTDCFVGRGKVDFDGLLNASAKMSPEAIAMIRLAAALSQPARPADISQTFAALANTPSFEVAIHALRLRWEF